MAGTISTTQTKRHQQISIHLSESCAQRRDCPACQSLHFYSPERAGLEHPACTDKSLSWAHQPRTLGKDTGNTVHSRSTSIRTHHWFPCHHFLFSDPVQWGPQNMRIHRSVPTASPALAASLEEAAGVGTGCLPSRVEGSNQQLGRACESPRWFKSTHHCGQIAVALRLKFHLFGGNAYIELISTLTSHM